MIDLAKAARKLQGRAVRSAGGCLVWTRARDYDGYGMVRVGGVQHRAHRVAWQLKHRRPIPEGLIVRHTCDNPPCIEPAHLLLGTNQDNVNDRSERQRADDRRGEKCPTAKLTWADVAVIRQRLSRGEAHAAIASDYAVSRRAISKLAAGETWRPSGADITQPEGASA